jgi:hypothetical protein
MSATKGYTAVVHGCVLPSQVSEVRVDGYADDFHIALFEFIQTMIEGDDFGRAYKSEIQRVEEHHGSLGFDVLFQVEILVDIVVAHHGNSGEIGGGFAD